MPTVTPAVLILYGSGGSVQARLEYGWRWLSTGACLAAFGISGLLFSLVLFPLGLLWPHKASRTRAVTRLIHLFFRFLIATLQCLGVMTLEVQGRALLAQKRPLVVIANHPTWLDVMVLLSLMPSACCVVKNAHWRNPCFWGIVRAAEYISNAEPTELIAAGVERLGAGYSLIIFPEGTRSKANGTLHPFSRGFAYLALTGSTAVQPVLLECTPLAFGKHQRWFHIPDRPFCMRVVVLDQICADDWVDAGMPGPIAARTLTQAMQLHISKQLSEYGFSQT
jgi:1-acyl-sn-glycerol-3-phosphate acyltransferase